MDEDINNEMMDNNTEDAENTENSETGMDKDNGIKPLMDETADTCAGSSDGIVPLMSLPLFGMTASRPIAQPVVEMSQTQSTENGTQGEVRPLMSLVAGIGDTGCEVPLIEDGQGDAQVPSDGIRPLMSIQAYATPSLYEHYNVWNGAEYGSEQKWTEYYGSTDWYGPSY